MEEAPAERTWRPSAPVDVRATLSILRRGVHDPILRFADDGTVWRTSWTVEGPATIQLIPGPTDVTGRSWGPGAAAALAAMPALLGAGDDVSGFEAGHPRVAAAHRAFPGLRVPRTGNVAEALVPAVIEQKVVGLDAWAAWRRLVVRFGSPPPGPAPTGMVLAPAPAGWAAIPSWAWHRAGVDARRARTVVSCLADGDRLERLVDLPLEQAYTRLVARPGLGPWTAAEIGRRALGDADAVSVGDAHTSHLVGHVLTGRPVDDEAMLGLLEPWRPHRQRVVRLLELRFMRSLPRRAPRRSRVDDRRR